MKLTLTYVGQPKEVQTKFGLKQKNSVKAQEKGDTYLSFWVTPSTRDWKVGDVVEVQDVTSREYQGKTYYDIVMPKASGGLPPEVGEKLERILVAVTKMNLKLDTIYNEMEKKPRDMKKEYAPFLDNETHIPDPSVIPFEDKKKPEEPNFDEVSF